MSTFTRNQKVFTVGYSMNCKFIVCTATIITYGDDRCSILTGGIRMLQNTAELFATRGEAKIAAAKAEAKRCEEACARMSARTAK